MTRNSDPLFNLADALSADIVAAPADARVHDAGSDPGGRAGLVGAFDRIAARAAAQSRWQRIVERLRSLLHGLPAPIGWTSAMAGGAGIFVLGIVTGMPFHQADLQIAAAPPRAPADRPARDASGTGIKPRSGPPAAVCRMRKSGRRDLIPTRSRIVPRHRPGPRRPLPRRRPRPRRSRPWRLLPRRRSRPAPRTRRN